MTYTLSNQVYLFTLFPILKHVILSSVQLCFICQTNSTPYSIKHLQVYIEFVFRKTYLSTKQFLISI